MTTSLATVPFAEHPIQLWIGNKHRVLESVEHRLQKMFCANNGCMFCVECHKIHVRQHQDCMWIIPEKTYTREHIEPILQTIIFQRNNTHPFFFILQGADFLTDSCANSLLKSIEEPPQGYCFILLAERTHMVLPTIRSRCLIYALDYTVSNTHQQALFDHFSYTQKLPAQQFLHMLDTIEINERETIELLDALLAHWRICLHKAIQADDKTQQMHAITSMQKLTKAAQKPPMPGSSNLFWKNLFLYIQTPISKVPSNSYLSP